MKILIVTTKNFNPGDDFIREGLLSLISKLDTNVEYEYFDKHTPTFTNFRIYGKSKILNWRITRYIYKIINIFNSNYLGRFDAIIHSGAPFFYDSKNIFRFNTYSSEWFLNLYRGGNSKKIKKLLLIAIGSNLFKDEKSEDLIKSKKIIKTIHSLKKINLSLITARDPETSTILKKQDLLPLLLPCTAFFCSSARYDDSEIKEGDYVIFNYMKYGIIKKRNSNTNVQEWEKVAKEVVEDISKNFNVLILSHSVQDYLDCLKIFPDQEHFYSENYQDYFEVYENSIGGIYNRVHGAMLSLSNLKPTILISADSRKSMFSMFDFPTYKINEVSSEKIVYSFKELLYEKDNFSKYLTNIKEINQDIYLNELKKSLLS